MIRSRSLTIILFIVMIEAFNDDPSIPREILHLNVGQRIRMDCQLNSSIIADLRKGLWLRLEDAEVYFYGTSRISPDFRYQIEERTRLQIFNQSFSYEIVTYSLIIERLERSDEGTYSCQADNRIIRLFSLNLIERPSFLLDQSTTLYRRRLGESLSIHCYAQGKPNPSISWRKKLNETHQDILFNCSMTSSNCSLIFSDLRRIDQGIYECLATNPYGTIGRFYQLDVQFRPSIEMFSSIDDKIHLNCLIDGNPRPDIRWFQRISSNSDNNNNDEEEINSTNICLIKHEQLNSTRWKTSLFIPHIRSSHFQTIFICRAENSLGTHQRSFGLSPKIDEEILPTTIRSFLPSSSFRLETFSYFVFIYLLTKFILD